MKLRQLCRQKYRACLRALNPLILAVLREVGFSEVLGLVSVGLVAWGVGLMWFPLAPLVVGLVGLAVAVINARMRQ